jgi:hypothetical protein
MKTNFKFTGVNIASALLVIAYFFPWADGIISVSGYNLTGMGISPGMLSYVLSGMSRLVFVLLALVPIGGAIILFQNLTGDMRFSKYYKPAHTVPALILIGSMAGAYFKMRPALDPAAEQVNNLYGSFGMNNMSEYMPRIDTPGLFDILSIGAYITLAASVYLLLAGLGKIKDKEYFQSASSNPVTTVNTDQN